MDNLAEPKYLEKIKNSNYYCNFNIKYFYEHEIKDLLSGIESENEFYGIVFQFIFETAARIDEARNVKYHDIDFKKSTVQIETSKQRKSSRSRILHISDNLAKKLLVAMTDKTFNKSDFIFAKLPGKNPVTRVAINKMLRKYVAKFISEDQYYYEKAHCHSLRHSRAVQLLDSGSVNIKKLQYILGHTNIANTLIYLQYVNKDIRRSMAEANHKLGLE